ncbi:MAG: tetratricopeptide repeat protein [Planctomycetota bacterium]
MSTVNRRFVRVCAFMLMLVTMSVAGSVAVAQGQQSLPDRVELSEAVATAMNAEWLTDDERKSMRVFHGVWDDRDLDSPERRAIAAVLAYDFDNPILTSPEVSFHVRADAAMRRGDLRDALALLEGVAGVRAARQRGEALESLGQYDEALKAVNEAIRIWRAADDVDAAMVTDGVHAMAIQARLQGQPARNYQTMLDELSRVRTDYDRLYWPARLAEAYLLAEKHNTGEAMRAAFETLSLNPRCIDAWYLLGRLSLQRFDFESSSNTAKAIRRLNDRHPLAIMLVAEFRLVRDDPDNALDVLTQLIDRYPKIRQAHALLACAHALRYDEPAMRSALDTLDTLSPGTAEGYALAGRYLSLFRQYDLSSDVLQEAIRRQPAWPEPQIELGLMELQAGRDAIALDALQSVASLDRFNKRAANSLFLLEEIADYHRIETEHFIIRYKPGIDEVLVRTMPDELERIHEIVTEKLQFEPDRKTIIEVLPDHERFAVRITGMPWIHTVAACTGPVIAMEVPREGRPSEHYGPFDWRRVIQHEYTHTVTLAQTQNRIPHWFTEAIAVRMELAPRDYDRCRMLADSLHEGTLFSLEEIKWAFVRPERPGDRNKAYAQGYWMVEFMEERFGNSAMIRLLSEYFEGVREAEAMPAALGVTREEFYREFLVWAAAQVESWGLSPEPSLESLVDEVREQDPELRAQLETSRQARLDVIARRLSTQIGRPGTKSRDELSAADWPPLIRPKVQVTDDMIMAWRNDHPDHPDLLEMEIRRRIDRREGTIEAGDVEMLEQLIKLRPVDPYPHKKLSQYWLDRDEAARAAEHLEELYVREQYKPVFAVELGHLYRELGQIEKALDRITRALHINPYHAATRETAAAIAIEAGEFEQARTHIAALVLLEPDRPRHQKRLDAINRLISERSTGAS